jgi:DNA polymerase III delta prime subunit
MTTFVAIILYEVDKLSTDALLYMGWLLERYKGCNKVFFCCSDVTKLQPIKAICTVVKLLPPTNEEVRHAFVIKFLTIKLKFTMFSRNYLNNKL